MPNTIYPWKLVNSLRAKPTLGQLVDLCEENYSLLHKIAPDLKNMQGKYISSCSPHIDLHLEILEQSPYTSLIHLTYFFEQQNAGNPDAILRVYHDSRQLEVIDLKEKSLPLLNSYQHPGLLLKWKANIFVSKWLSYCRFQGHHFAAEPSEAAIA